MEDLTPQRETLKIRHHKPDLREWSLDAIDVATGAINDAIRKAAAEAIQVAMTSKETYLEWPAEWGDRDGHGDENTPDPLTIYLRVDLGSDFDKAPIYSFNLRDALRYALDCNDGSYAEGLSNIRDALRNLADEIDAAVTTPVG